jgi:TRAP transporter TAXI family solute receptor
MRLAGIFARCGAGVVAVLAVASCEVPRASTPPPVLRFRTGMPGAGFHPLGEAITSAYLRTPSGPQMDIQQSAGSVSNLEALQRGTADLGLAFADVAYMGYAGRLIDHPERLDRIRGIAVLHLTPVQLMVRGGTGITRISDLQGRRVGLGPPGSGTALTATLVLDAYGIGAGEVRSEALLFNEAAHRLVRGTLDAMFVNAGYPAESVRMAAAAGGRLLPVNGGVALRLRRDYPFLRQTVVPGGTYPGHPDAVHTIGVDSVLICRSDLDDNTVYDVTKTFFAVLPSLVADHPSLRLIDLEQVPATPIPLHRGAARYYRERELSR